MHSNVELSLDEGNKGVGGRAAERAVGDQDPWCGETSRLLLKISAPRTTRMVSASGGSLSKSESLVKDDSRLDAKKQQVRKTCSSGGGEFTKLGEVHGRGAGVNSATVAPLPSPALCVYSDVGEKAEDVPKIKLVSHCIVNVC